jgi:hypothetical protein
MLIRRTLAVASLCLLGTSISATAQDDRSPLAAGAKTQATSEFRRGGKSNRLPCDFYGPCGKCDCPSPSGGKGATNQ